MEVAPACGTAPAAYLPLPWVPLAVAEDLPAPAVAAVTLVELVVVGPGQAMVVVDPGTVVAVDEVVVDPDGVVVEGGGSVVPVPPVVEVVAPEPVVVVVAASVVVVGHTGSVVVVAATVEVVRGSVAGGAVVDGGRVVVEVGRGAVVDVVAWLADSSAVRRLTSPWSCLTLASASFSWPARLWTLLSVVLCWTAVGSCRAAWSVAARASARSCLALAVSPWARAAPAWPSWALASWS